MEIVTYCSGKRIVVKRVLLKTFSRKLCFEFIYWTECGGKSGSRKEKAFMACIVRF